VLPPDLVAVLTDRHKRAQANISSRTASRIVAVWDSLPTIGEEQYEAFLAAIAPFLTAAKQAAVTSSTGFYAAVLETRPPAIPVGSVDVEYRGRTPFTATWHALSEGRPYVEAVDAGRSIAEAQTERFVVSTSRRTGDAVVKATGRDVRWRRVPSSKACPFCVNAAGQLYRSAESADFGHDRCGCAAVPAA
jgi:hypothetical protein